MKYALILAGGSGIRAGGEIPKQFVKLGDVPVLWWSVRAFHSADAHTRIRIVMNPGFFDLWDILYAELPEADRSIPVEIVCGGRSRLESVRNGMVSIPEDAEALIAVHDAARPFVSREMIARGWETAARHDAAVPVVPMTDSIRHLESDGGSVAEDRSRYVRVQTPQIFRLETLRKAYGRELTARMTDDASVAEAAGVKVTLYDGEESNIKITNPMDFRIAEAMIR